MNIDIAERLRHSRLPLGQRLEAASEIDRLRKQVEAMKDVVADGAIFTDADHWQRWKEASA